jgi:putative tricarboxylic transport membrane protein
MWSLILSGLEHCLELSNLGFMLLGTMLGVVMGALPGLSATTGMALLLPLTFGMDVGGGLLMLAGIYCGALYGGSISAILIGIPGTAAALPTTFEGYPMARSGRASEALLYALYASVFGGLVSSMVLLFLTPVVAEWALEFGPPEIFALCVCGISIVAFLVGKDPVKGLIMAVVGFIVSTVGADPAEGVMRMTFGNYRFIGGMQFVPVILGTLALPRIFEMVERFGGDSQTFFAHSARRFYYLNPLTLFKRWFLFLRSAVIGVVIGIAPAAGPTIAALVSYNEARRVSDSPETYGSGNPEGVIASEAANNGATGGSLIPTFALGIPGCPAAAMLMAALIMKGVQPGPALLQNNADILYTFFIGFILVNLLILLVGHGFVQIGHSIIRTPIEVLAPVLFTVSLIGAFSAENDMFNVYIMLIFGIAAYFLGKFDYPMAPFILAFILGPIMEANFWASFHLSYGDYFIFFKRPLSLLLMAVAVFTVLWPMVIARFRKRPESTKT